MKVKVWNQNIHPYTEKFRGRQITIEPGKHIVMDQDEANIFYGTFCPRIKTADGVDDPVGFKMLKLEPITTDEPKAETKPTINCAACKYQATTEKDLEEHTKVTHASLERLVDEVAEEEIKRRRTKKSA